MKHYIIEYAEGESIYSITDRLNQGFKLYGNPFINNNGFTKQALTLDEKDLAWNLLSCENSAKGYGAADNREINNYLKGPQTRLNLFELCLELGRSPEAIYTQIRQLNKKEQIDNLKDMKNIIKITSKRYQK